MQSRLELSRTAHVSKEELRLLTDEQLRLLQVIDTLSMQSTKPILLQEILPLLQSDWIELNVYMNKLMGFGLVEWHNPGWKLTQRGAGVVTEF